MRPIPHARASGEEETATARRPEAEDDETWLEVQEF
jgi:hypothetical protein